MKKVLSFFAAVIACSAAFANVELNVGVAGVPVYESHFAGSDITPSASIPFAVGASADVSVYFGKGLSQWDVGLNFLDSIVFNTETACNNASYKGFGLTNDFEIGPVFRYSLNTVNAIFLSPGFDFMLAMNEQDKDSGIGTSSFGFGPHLNLGYRGYFINKPGFHLGLNCGVDYAFVWGNWKGYKNLWSDKEEFDGNNLWYSGKMKIYAGVTFNFGDRNIDRLKHSENSVVSEEESKPEDLE